MTGQGPSMTLHVCSHLIMSTRSKSAAAQDDGVFMPRLTGKNGQRINAKDHDIIDYTSG